MQWLAYFKIKYKMLLMLFFPIIGLLYFSILVVTDKYRLAAEMDSIESLAIVAIKTAEMIHQIQRERLTSVKFLKNHGHQFRDKLTEERLKTDELINEFTGLSKKFETQTFHHTTNIIQVNQVFQGIVAQREAVFELSISELKAIKGYGEINQVLIDFIKHIATLSTDKKIFTLELAYIHFLAAKELASLESSMLVNALTQKYFERGEFQHFVELVAQQQVYQQIIFKYLATNEQKAFFDQIVTGKAIDETKKIRESVYETANDGLIENIEPEFWANMQTQKIELLKKVEQKLSDDLRAKVRQIHHSAHQDFNFALLMVLAILTLTTLFVIIIPKRLTTRLRQAVGIANAIAAGNLDNQIETCFTDEMGQLLQAFASMQTQLRERIEEDKRIADEALRINCALDNVTTYILITDNHHKIIYLNDSAKQLFISGEEVIRRDLPHFEANRILGTTIDSFHKNPSYQRNILDSLTSTHRGTFTIGGLTFNIVITPVINTHGERLGTVVELTNRTQEVAIEQEINQVIQAASSGDFQQRIQLENQSGFFKLFSESINKIMVFNQNMIEDTMRMFAALAQGKLTQKIDNNYTGAFEQLKNDANMTVKRLTEIMTEISLTAETVSAAAEEISQGNSSISQRTEELATSFEEIAASLEQMTSTVQQTADNTKQVTQLAISATEHAETGGDVVGATIHAMTEINKSSNKIADMTGIINEIAFQTNLLALNAAVEAAHAGEHGRGFAVVTSEIRNLAGRSAVAAKEIKALIQDSAAKVEEGTKLANQSGETLEKIVLAVKTVSDLITGIASASQEQAIGIQYINKAVLQMDNITQQNMAVVEEAAAASEAMSAEAQNLKQQVAFFQLGKEKH